MDATLVVMAAGIGSRFKIGIKQLEGIGPNKELLLEYSVYDAVDAGFNRIIFVIRRDIEKDFHERMGSSIEKRVKIEYAYQELFDLPDGYTPPETRTKPWGTGHAVLAARHLINEPFAVINADDYYGKDGFQKIYDFLVNNKEENCCCMAGFILGNTLSDNGAVTRGLCKADNNKIVTEIAETKGIEKINNSAVVKSENKDIVLDMNSYVSMNMWGFKKDFIKELEKNFYKFLDENLDDLNAEYLLPSVVNQLIEEDRIKVFLLETNDIWYGMTYKDDVITVVNAIKSMIDKGIYPNKLY